MANDTKADRISKRQHQQSQYELNIQIQYTNTTLGLWVCIVMRWCQEVANQRGRKKINIYDQDIQ